MLNILVLGHSGSGKTVAAKMIARLLGSKPPRNCSDFIIRDYAKENDLDLKEILKNKDDYRKELFEYGLKRQSVDPAYPVSEAFKHTHIVTGVRTTENLSAAKSVIKDLIVLWIDRSSTNQGATDKLGPEYADLIVDNNGTLEDLNMKLMSIFVK